MIYGDRLALTSAQEKTLSAFVDAGHGLVALHAVGDLSLIGARLQPQGGADFTAEIVQPANPVVQGLQPFAAWEEPLAPPAPGDRTVIMERVDTQGRQPWTWLRTQGKGRIFYTGYGHDERTWGNAGFQSLVERGIVWSVDEGRRRSWQQLEMPGVTYLDGFNVPNYENRPDPPKFQLPFPPDQAEKFMQTPGDFRIELFASEPDIIKPITFTFDERGRLWVVEAMDYPNEVLNGNPGDDRIKILEDTNGDGRADKITVFAEHLNLPTSLTFANGGVIVAAAPHFLFLKDTNGDDKADVRQVLNTGWGIRDSHAGPSNLQYGPDNYIWGVVGYSGFDGQMNGKPLQFTQGPYRFKPDGSDFEYLTTSTNNTWGLGFSETFDVFGSTANNDPSWYTAFRIDSSRTSRLTARTGGRRGVGLRLPEPGAASRPFIRPRLTFDRSTHTGLLHRGRPATCFYTARAYPKEYLEPRRLPSTNQPCTSSGQGVIEPQGAGYRGPRRLEPDLER